MPAIVLEIGVGARAHAAREQPSGTQRLGINQTGRVKILYCPLWI
jgi:hypothetical protein